MYVWGPAVLDEAAIGLQVICLSMLLFTKKGYLENEDFLMVVSKADYFYLYDIEE